MTVTPPVVLPPAPKPKSVFARILNGLRAAVTSPTAVKQERSLAALIVGRVLLAAGASYGVEQIATKIIGG